ncbi:adenylate/guanylate cyclase domain-containing protein [Pelagibius sp.]|uniref:adenylate/guanylate cyclase domain-containing protein n=1 Tax=Pelagibius sp. TaxID=1931238 RepID=UPI003B5113C3
MSSRWKPGRAFTIATVLPALLALLVVAAVVPVIATTYVVNASNANALLSTRAELLVDGLENQLRGLLDPINAQLSTARDLIEQSELDFEDPVRFETYVEGMISGTPQMSGIGVIRPDGTMRRWERGRPGAIEEPPDALPLVGQALAEAGLTDQVRWSAPFVSLVLRDTILNPRISIRRDGGIAGILTAGVTGRRLSEYVSALSEGEVTAFILYDRDKLIAYPNRSPEEATPTSTRLPTIQDSSLAIIRDIWVEQNEVTQSNKMVRTEGHWAPIDGTPYAYFYREITGYAPEPLLVGVAIASAESRWFRWAALLAAAFGVVLLGIAVVAACVMGRRIAAPMVQIEDALSKLENMEFDRVALPQMSRSRIAEWRNSATRLTKTATALASFNQYVPGKLARRLMNRPQDAVEPQERPVTVMFVDMEGFSAFARTHTAQQAAERLNAVFGLIGPIIENHGGVIDKYTGDGLMAFWGAPDLQEDHRRRAIDAAQEIRRVVDEVSAESWFDGTPRLRIGLHAGPAIVGNLGFEGRVNYTLVGTTVNTAERVEQGLRGRRPDQSVIIGMSQEMYDQVGPAAGLDAAETLQVGHYHIVVL